MPVGKSRRNRRNGRNAQEIQLDAHRTACGCSACQWKRRWIVDQDRLLQVMVFGQTPAADRNQIARIVLSRLAGKGKR